ncbi:hypothetical protein [Candidatus Nitrosocosmicus arcticus]|uniref:Uncharacterized protein n=1 Tax=Candidatus Nitrosocosmicus arcticus TaxID=2035267 RepID=A0A557SS76_9ARCH|nr:hypothetical protein [Candidatus Nitrosocosmicus arcticus]TVP39464.1 hypothetical protein NARC_150058 [Candidatus Nitrosocosmicus arcticus]
MNEKTDSSLNSKMQKSVYIFVAFFVISAILFNNGNTVYSINQGIISGTGYGNSGERFGSFISCSETDEVHYFKGSTIHFETSLSDNSAVGKNSGTSLGSWVIEFTAENSLSPVRIGGQIIESNLDRDTYTLLGEKTFDNVCNNIGNIITLTGGCGENTRIWYSDSNNEKVGSITPPDGDKAFYLLGSEVDCV